MPAVDEKETLRRTLLQARRDRSAADRTATGEAIAAHASGSPVLARARRVAAYLSMPTEPPTGPLIDGLRARHAEVLVPVVANEHALQWVQLDAAVATSTSPLGIPEPAGERRGPEALLGCDLVVVPAMAVDHAGHRLGRGAGYYDRALEDVTAPICAVVFADELLASVPHEPHDVGVSMALTPSGLFRTEVT